MKSLLWLAAWLALAHVAEAQPFPLPQDQSTGSAVTSDAHGRQYETVKTPTGWVTYGPNGERFETAEKPSGGTVTYGPAGERWEEVPAPATPPPRAQSKREGKVIYLFPQPADSK